MSGKSAAEVKYGSLAKHRAFNGKPPRRGGRTPFPCEPSEVFAVQVDGLAARLKAIGCRDVVLGLSGGLDSTLALLVAVEAFRKLKYDPKGIHAIGMPGFGTGKRTRSNAGRLCEGLGLKLETIPIVKSVRQHLRDIGHDGITADIAYENAQARMRTMILMDRANMCGGIVLGTGDLSEIALGWCTYNGDHMSMFGVNSGVPKTVIRRVCEWYAMRRNPKSRKAAESILDIVATPVSPELKKGQVTEDTIGPYELHDFFLWNFIVNEMGPADLAVAAEDYFSDDFPSGMRLLRFPRETVRKTLGIFLRRMLTQAFKRNCQPDGIRVFPFELSLHGWWIPSTLASDPRAAGFFRLP